MIIFIIGISTPNRVPKIFKFIFLVIFFLFLQALKVESKGIFVKVERFTSPSFSPMYGETASLNFFVLKNSNITVRIYNFASRRIFEKKIGFFYEGKHIFHWDGMDYDGRIVKSGFYKCEILASESGYNFIDSDYAVISVKGPTPPDMRKSHEEDKSKHKVPFEISGLIRTITETDTKGFFNPARTELSLDIKGRQGREWKYDLRFFPYYDPAEPFQWSDFVEGKMGYYSDNWEIETGYHNFMKGYDDLLNIFADYRMPYDRMSITTKLNLNRNSNLNCGVHHAFSSNEYALEAGYSYDISKIAKINACTVNKITGGYSNNVLTMWTELSNFKDTIISTEIGGSVVSTQPGTSTQPLQYYGMATKGEIKHRFPHIYDRYCLFGISCAVEYIQKNFICELADLPNGNDNAGLELTGEYGTDAGIYWLDYLNLEIKKAYFTSIDGSIVRQKFRPALSARFFPGLTCRAHYDYTGIENANDTTSPLRRIRNAYGELHYMFPSKKMEIVTSYATASTTGDSRTEYTSTNVVLNYYLIDALVPYFACEKIVKITQDTREIDCYFWKTGLNWDFCYWQKHKTKVRLQTGYVMNNIGGLENKIPYYAELQQHVFETFSLIFSYGSLSAIEPLQKFLCQVKLEFR